MYNKIHNTAEFKGSEIAKSEVFLNLSPSLTKKFCRLRDLKSHNYKSLNRKEKEVMEELKVFENAEFGSVRTTTVNGEIMFVGKDVAEILGYSNPRKAIIDHIDEEDKG